MMAIVRDQYSGDAMADHVVCDVRIYFGPGHRARYRSGPNAGVRLACHFCDAPGCGHHRRALAQGLDSQKHIPREAQTVSARAFVGLAFREVIRHRVTVGYTVAAGFIFAPFIGFLSSCQQVFAGVYGQGDNFPYLFGILALAIGSASAVNGKLVLRWGMRRLLNKALSVATVAGLVFAGYALLSNSRPVFPCSWLTSSSRSFAMECCSAI